MNELALAVQKVTQGRPMFSAARRMWSTSEMMQQLAVGLRRS
jgi:hypothetical protein